MLAQSFSADKHDASGWHMSEKLDGLRAGWNGSQFYSRNGNVFNAPDWFCDAMPSHIELDGELFIGRGQFQNTVGRVKRKVPIDSEWRDIRYHVFDVLNKPELTFEQRVQFLKDNIDCNGKHSSIRLVEHCVCDDNEHVAKALDDIVAADGEGLMLRQPGSFYEEKRSHTLLKVKKAYDAEARVIGHVQGKGRHSKRCGALTCQMASGKTFNLGSGLTDKDRDDPPPIGSIVTYRFTELTDGKKPRHPRFLRVRPDVDEPKDFE